MSLWLEAFARERQFGYLDYFSALAEEDRLMQQALTDDGLHPNPDGYQRMAEMLERSCVTQGG